MPVGRSQPHLETEVSVLPGGWSAFEPVIRAVSLDMRDAALADGYVGAKGVSQARLTRVALCARAADVRPEGICPKFLQIASAELSEFRCRHRILDGRLLANGHDEPWRAPFPYDVAKGTCGHRHHVELVPGIHGTGLAGYAAPGNPSVSYPRQRHLCITAHTNTSKTLT